MECRAIFRLYSITLIITENIKMATNKHAQIRYNTLDKCFSNPGRNWTLSDLLESCNNAILEFDPKAEGIKKRQLQEDIRFMKSDQGWGIELNEDLKIGRKKVYRYLNPKFSISNQPINEADANHLKIALATLSKFNFDWIDELSVRLEDKFNLTSHSKNIIKFEENEFLTGKEYITVLYNAISYKKVLNITYQSFKSNEPINFSLHPYYLKQYNSRWFLFGKDERFETLTNIALDRIEKIEELDITYLETEIDFEEYFEDVIGVTVPTSELEKVSLKVSNDSIDYIDTKPLHGSQKIKERNENYGIIELNVIPNYELESQLLSFGDHIEVLTPLSLRLRLKERVNKLAGKYKN